MRRSILFMAALLSAAPVLARAAPDEPSRTMRPAPLPPGEAADIPGGTSRNGVVRPPPTGDRAIRHTPPRGGAMMVIPPATPHGREQGGAGVSPR